MVASSSGYRLVRWGVWGTALILTMNAVRLAVPLFKGQRRQTDGPNVRYVPVPHTVVIRNVAHGADGVDVVGFDETLAVRSDGSRVSRREGSGASTYYVLRTIHFASGDRIEIDDVRELKSTESGRYDWLDVRDPASNCLKSVLGRPVALNQHFVKLETVEGHSAAIVASSRLTIWYALDLGCEIVKTRVAPTLRGYSAKDPIVMRTGEPDPALFVVPAHYREAPPSVLHHLDPSTAEARGVDDDYRAHQRK